MTWRLESRANRRIQDEREREREKQVLQGGYSF